MDVIAEYTERYKHLPDPAMPWGLFVELSRRCGKYEARDWLRAIDGPSFAVESLVPEGQGQRMLFRKALVEQAKA